MIPKRHQLLTITLVILLTAFTTIPASAVTFSGNGNLTTDTFDISKYGHFTWSTVPENEFDFFSAAVYNADGNIQEELYDGANGSTYFYKAGTFYLEIVAANILSWTLDVQQTDGVFLKNQDTITGVEGTDSELFQSYSDTTISWTTTAANEFDLFTVFIEEIDGFSFNTFDGPSGTTKLFDEGVFYFNIIAANLLSWSISIDVLQAADASSTNTDSTGQTNDTQNDNAASSEAYFPIYFAAIPILILSVIPKLYKRNNS